MQYLLDTNVVINFLEASLSKNGMLFLNSIVDENPVVSVITKIETLGFNFSSAKEQTTIEAFINGSAMLSMNDDIVAQTISLRKIKKIKLPDAIIAATALVYDMTLITRNSKDFTAIEGLKIIDPHSL